MQSATCFLLLAVGLTIASAQMTFSDGWGVKRSDPKAFLPQRDSGGIDTPMLDECHSSYSSSLAGLHNQILSLYEKYQECQNRAITIFQSKSQPANQ